MNDTFNKIETKMQKDLEPKISDLNIQGQKKSISQDLESGIYPSQPLIKSQEHIQGQKENITRKQSHESDFSSSIQQIGDYGLSIYGQSLESQDFEGDRVKKLDQKCSEIQQSLKLIQEQMSELIVKKADEGFAEVQDIKSELNALTQRLLQSDNKGLNDGLNGGEIQKSLQIIQKLLSQQLVTKVDEGFAEVQNIKSELNALSQRVVQPDNEGLHDGLKGGEIQKSLQIIQELLSQQLVAKVDKGFAEVQDIKSELNALSQRVVQPNNEGFVKILKAIEETKDLIKENWESKANKKDSNKQEEKQIDDDQEVQNQEQQDQKPDQQGELYKGVIISEDYLKLIKKVAKEFRQKDFKENVIL